MFKVLERNSQVKTQVNENGKYQKSFWLKNDKCRI